MTPSASRCPRCHAVLPADAPSGLCPTCLVSVHFGTEADLTDPAVKGAPPPAIEEIALHFPQLEILACLGRGGMGVVYKARQKSLDRVVALKLLAPERGSDPAFAERFAREAQALARLDHPHIVTIYDFGQAGGFFYLLMEYVDGVTLRHLLHGGRIAPREALAIVPQICDALQFAHDHGIVHRDIKPENILLDRRGQAKVADFGLAKLVGPGGEPATAAGDVPAGSSSEMTEAGKVMGTPRYMAPEQRERPAEVDHRADIYALGVVLYQMLTGELPDEKQLQPPSRRVHLDVRLDEIVLRALEKEPERRYANATEFKTQLETVASTPPPPAPPAAPPPAGPLAQAGVRAQVAAPAIAMMIVSALDLACLCLFLLIGAVVLMALPVVGGMIGMNQFNLSQVVPWMGAMAGLVILFVIGWLLLHVAAAIYVIVAARRMHGLRYYRSACTGAILLIVIGALGVLFSFASPTHLLTAFWSLIELGVGIWALVVLRRPEVKESFDQASPAVPPVTPVDPAEPLRQLSTPAIGLMVASALHLLFIGIGALFLLGNASLAHGLFVPAAPGPASPPVWARLALALAMAALLLLPPLLTFIGAWRMRQLRGRGFAMAAAILAILTFQGLGLGVVFGIWTLVVLTRREVEAAFAQSAPRSRSGWLLATVVLAGCILATLVAGGLFWLSSNHHRVNVSTPVQSVHPVVKLPAPPVVKVSDLPPLPSGALDLAPYWTSPFLADTDGKSYGLRALRGLHSFDGIPFLVGGQVLLSGSETSSRSNGTPMPDQVSIPVGRAFAELHLLHAVHWQDPVGVVIATLRFVYADGDTRSIPLRYGVHLLDWQRLPGEDVEPLSDLASKIVWRGPGTPEWSATSRATVTTVTNPRPGEVVDHIEFVSNNVRSSYALLAATLAAGEAGRAQTAPVPAAGGARHFTGEIRIHVVDTVTREPLAGAFVDPSGVFAGINLIAQPLFTDAGGVARVHYDPGITTEFRLNIHGTGYAPSDIAWTAPDQIPADLIVRLNPAISGRPAKPSSADIASGRTRIDDLRLSATITLQHEMLLPLVNEWLNQESASGAGHETRVAALLRVCAELARRGACPGFVAALEAPDLPSVPAEERRPWRTVPSSDLEDELTIDLHRLGQRQLTGAAPDETDLHLVHQATLAAAELFVRGGWHPARGNLVAKRAATSDAVRRDLAIRLSAASTITNWSEKDEALSSLVVDAARAGETEIVQNALKQMSNGSTRDQAIRAAALALKAFGLSAEAIKLAGTLTSSSIRDQTLKELSQ
ncbi:MAG: protein kinase [Verrucomicrobia bacterium]|nr:protein kinase [Verrucomicrobiota bacterium]